ncbi:hypothetical protein NQ317_015465 [Molorchus minor]|uniref:Uncharacterized protein n=1 Tax=Molorchus minor TaxID=1323400 RepID=A0ABQ9J007_9CUCU|nr:hypothetical protein NQ317_015465 [Molorchus minor]
MKAAKDGQDGEECLAHGGCPSLSAQPPSPAMLTTFNDINKLCRTVVRPRTVVGSNSAPLIGVLAPSTGLTFQRTSRNFLVTPDDEN